MDTNYQQRFWRQRLTACKAALEKNNFDVFIAENGAEARRLFVATILPSVTVHSASWADSLSAQATGILEALKHVPGVEIIETFAADVPREVLLERRRQALFVDLFVTGTNALTESGQLVNLDMVGNRVAAITFGPRTVVLVIGRNKLVGTVEEGMQRIRTIAAPLNAIRHAGWKTPCRNTSVCHDCHSPDRICNVWSIVEKSFPERRIKIILVNEDLGL